MNDNISFEFFVAQAEEKGLSLSDVIINWEAENQGTDYSSIFKRMREQWAVMSQSAKSGIEVNNKSLSGLVGEEGTRLFEYVNKGRTLSGENTVLAAARAMGVAVVNASMGKIVAAPTAGSCGVLPGVLITLADKLAPSEGKIISSLFAAAGVGMVIDERATTSGAKGGCQAECGAAACMAAVAAVELAGGTPRQAAHAGAIALKNILGLVCDPVAGLVEIPCVKRNAMGAANALLAADLALAGIESKIPIDEVIGAMKEVGEALPEALRETARGGLAATPTGKKIAERLG